MAFPVKNGTDEVLGIPSGSAIEQIGICKGRRTDSDRALGEGGNVSMFVLFI